MARLISPDVEGRLDVRFIAPPDDLAEYFTMIYRLEVEVDEGEKVVDFIHPEWANLRFVSGANHSMQIFDPANPAAPTLDNVSFPVNGPTTRSIRFELGTNRLWGIGLRPLGWARFVGQPASDWINTIRDGRKEPAFAKFLPLADVLCDPAGKDERQWESLIRFFRGLSAKVSDSDRAEEARIRAIQAAKENPYLANSDEFAEAAGMHKRTLERLCKKHFGFSPRTLIRRRRMNRSLADFMLSDGENWTRSIDRHYHDQPHFVREFRTFMGMSPTEYAELPHPITAAFMDERRRVWGSPVRADIAPLDGSPAGTDV